MRKIKGWEKELETEGNIKWIKYTLRSNIVVDVHHIGSYPTQWRFMAYTPAIIKASKIFTTKQKALSYAKTYMRKH